jgi:hypothetical protein
MRNGSDEFARNRTKPKPNRQSHIAEGGVDSV